MNINRIIYCLLLITVAISILSQPVAAGPPDILILMTDQQNWRAMSCAGTPGIDTPNMDGLAKQGVRFTHAICVTPQCSPARAATWTGLYPHRTGVMGNVYGETNIPAGQSPPLDTNINSIGKIFAQAGYETVYFGKWHLGNNPGKHGFEVHDIKKVRGRPLTDCAIDYLRKRSLQAVSHRPMLMIVSYINPHDIYYTEHAYKVDVKSQIRLPMNFTDDLSTKPLPQQQYRTNDQSTDLNPYTSEDWLRYIAYYYKLTEGVDAQIGLVLKEFRRHCHNSLTVFLSDHGDLVGAHGLGFKGPMMYEELVRVPLIVSWPDRIAPSICDQLVSQIDILPTLCDLADVRAPTVI